MQPRLHQRRVEQGGRRGQHIAWGAQIHSLQRLPQGLAQAIYCLLHRLHTLPSLECCSAGLHQPIAGRLMWWKVGRALQVQACHGSKVAPQQQRQRLIAHISAHIGEPV